MDLSSSIRDIHLSNPASFSGMARSKSSTSLLFGGFRRTSASVVRRDNGNNKRFSWFGSPASHISNQLITTNGSRVSLVERPSQYPNSAPDHGAHRTLVFIKRACHGVRDAIALTERKIEALRAAVNETGDGQEANKHLKDAEKHSKRLEYYLGLLEELYEAYVVEHRMREGVRAIERAYIHSNGPEKDAALSEVKLGFKDCNYQLSILERQLESLSGVLHIQMKGLQGFARLCSGDVFEVHVKIGSQKWRTKGRIGRDGSQHWDSTSRVFNIPVNHLLYIRVMEIRTLGKQVLLGNKYCETLDLLCTQSQLMTINLSLSLRLNLVVTWDPLTGLNKERNTSSKPMPYGSIENKSRSMSSQSLRSSYARNLHRQPSSSLEELSDVDDSTPTDKDPAGEPADGAKVRNGHASHASEVESGNGSAREEGSSNQGSELGSVDNSGETPLPRRSSAHDDPNQAAGLMQSKSDENFLLVRRNEPANQHWWQNRFYSSPTHTIDSGYDDSFRASNRRRIVINPMSPDGGEESPEYANSAVSENLHWQSNVIMRKKPSEPYDADESASSIGAFGFGRKTNKPWTNDVTYHLDSSLSSGDGAQQQRGKPRQNSDWSAAKYSLESVLCYLNNTIADIQGQYSDLEIFERSIASLYQRLLVQQEVTGGGRSSGLGMDDIDDVMGSFDFLDSEDTNSNHYESMDNLDSNEPRVLFTPQLDETLLIHLSYSRHLVDGLGSYGPLKCQEKQAVKKLQVQGRILNKLSKLIERWQNNPSTKLVVFEELHGLPHLQKLWEVICSGSRSLFVTAGTAVGKLSPLSDLTHVSVDRLEKVMQKLVSRCQDLPKFDPQSRLTVFQFRYFVRSKERSFQTRVDEINSEIEIIDALDSTKHFVIQKTITRLSLMGLLPNSNVLIRMSRFLLDPSDDPENPRVLVASYLRNTAKDANLRQKLVETFFEGLESYPAEERQGSCCALGILKEEQAIEPLAYLAQSDSVPAVRERAKKTLQSFGPRGQEMLQQLQLSSYGFQGVNIA